MFKNCGDGYTTLHILKATDLYILCKLHLNKAIIFLKNVFRDPLPLSLEDKMNTAGWSWSPVLPHFSEAHGALQQ